MIDARERGPFWVPLLILAVLWGIAVAALYAIDARAEPPNNATDVIRDSLGSLSDTDGWCEAISTTPENLWSSAPARITATIKGQVRFVEVLNIDASIVSCVLLGDSSDHASGASFACDDSSATSGRTAAGASRQFAVQRTSRTGGTIGTTPELWAVSASGTPTVCVTVGW